MAASTPETPSQHQDWLIGLFAVGVLWITDAWFPEVAPFLHWLLFIYATIILYQWIAKRLARRHASDPAQDFAAGRCTVGEAYRRQGHTL